MVHLFSLTPTPPTLCEFQTRLKLESGNPGFGCLSSPEAQPHTFMVRNLSEPRTRSTSSHRPCSSSSCGRRHSQALGSQVRQGKAQGHGGQTRTQEGQAPQVLQLGVGEVRITELGSGAYVRRRSLPELGRAPVRAPGGLEPCSWVLANMAYL